MLSLRVSLPVLAAFLLSCNGAEQPIGDASVQDTPSVRDTGGDASIDAPVGDSQLDSPSETSVDVASDTWCEDPGVQLGGGITVKPTNLAPGGQVTVIYDTTGQLGGSANLTLHYGFNFWSLDLGGEIAKDAPMTLRPDGSFEVTIATSAQARLLDFVFYTTNGSDKVWDNNNTADYHRGLGVPYSGPYLTWRDNTLNPGAKDRDPAHSVTVSFRSDRPCQGRVRYGTSGGALSQEVTGTPGERFHHLHIKGLAADTVYHYQVDCTDPSASCQVPEVSPINSFRTAPISPTSFTFIVMSDSQDNNDPYDLWRDVADHLTKPLFDDVRFVIITGDMTGDDQPDRWWTFFHKGRALFASKVLLPAAGNHDTPTWDSSATAQSFDELFEFESSSGQDTSYGLVYGSAAFLALNSETSQVSGISSDWQPGGTQYQWVQGNLAQLSTTWRFAFWHIPPHNAGVRHSNQAEGTRPITKLFNGEVDWVFCGHEHLYQRFQPIRYVGEDSSGKVISQVVTTYGRGPADGVGYLVSTTAGHYAPADTFLASGDPARAMLAYPPPQLIVSDMITPWVGYSKVQVKGKTITIQNHAYGETTPKDTVSYTKP